MTKHITIRNRVRDAFLITTLAAAVANLSAADLPGSSDYPGLKRYEGSDIIKYKTSDFDQYFFPTGGNLWFDLANPDEGPSFKKAEKIEGAQVRIGYGIPAGQSPYAVYRNFEKSFKAAGLSPLKAGELRELFNYSAWWPSQVESQGRRRGKDLMTHRDHLSDSYAFTSAGELNGKNVHLVFVLAKTTEQHPLHDKYAMVALLDIVEGAEVENKMVTKKASEMEKEIQETGRATLYGIHFDHDKTSVKPESQPTITEIASLLKGQPDLSLLVVGHTDNVGGFDYNQKLSMGRANAVVAELIANHGIAASRLKPAGMGFTSPVATNETDEGRALNRRVELVRTESISASR